MIINTNSITSSLSNKEEKRDKYKFKDNELVFIQCYPMKLY